MSVAARLRLQPGHVDALEGYDCLPRLRTFSNVVIADVVEASASDESPHAGWRRIKWSPPGPGGVQLSLPTGKESALGGVQLSLPSGAETTGHRVRSLASLASAGLKVGEGVVAIFA